MVINILYFLSNHEFILHSIVCLGLTFHFSATVQEKLKNLDLNKKTAILFSHIKNRNIKKAKTKKALKKQNIKILKKQTKT